MAFDKTTRNRLANFVGKARDLIADEFTQQFQSLYGISDNGTVTPLDKLSHLDDIGQATAALLRERIDYFIKTHPEERDGEKAAVTRLAREQAFTVLNRLAAIRMAEKRDLVVESVGKGYQSKGFKVFEQVAGAGLGDTYHRYRRYIFCLFDELAVDLGILFDRRSPQGLLFPRETALQELLTLLNAPDIEPLWGEDETIGWIYQYYNDPAERKKMRDESAAPRNSRELAVRNQFFTPRYVVEFLTDNTLGRIWYEMTQGGTSLKESCRYLVRRPDEVFFDDKLSPADARGKRWLNGDDVQIKDAYDLASTVNAYNRYHPVELASEWYRKSIDRVTAGEVEKFKTQELLDLLFLVHRADHFCEGTLDACEKEIKSIIGELSKRKAKENIDGLSQEELLRQPVYIPCREIKDPRLLTMLDPACGSMHFGLYAFDIYEVIYREALDPCFGIRDELLRAVGWEGNSRIHISPLSVKIKIGSAAFSDYANEEIPGDKAFVVVASEPDGGDGVLADRPYIISGDMKFRVPYRYHVPLTDFDYAKAINENWFAAEIGEKFIEESRCFEYAQALTEQQAEEEYLRQVPRMIIEHNIHGIDIDPRAVQIAGLSLWLRAQKSWQAQGVPAAQRPRITRSNIVCAEPMPGSAEMLKEFTSSLHPPILGQLVAKVFDRMKLAGEAGSLLKIEEEIAELIAEAKKLWSAPRKVEQTKFDLGQVEEQKQGELPLDVSGISDIQFWETAEEQIYKVIKDYAEQVDNNGYQRRLFAEDAARGFAFIDLCRKRYDVVVMNPPFGELPISIAARIKNRYPESSSNIGCTFVESCLDVLNKDGHLGTIIDYATCVRSSYEPFRRKALYSLGRLETICHSGWGVLDANVETCFYTLRKQRLHHDTVACWQITAGSGRQAENLIAQFETPRYVNCALFEVFPNGVPNFSLPLSVASAFKLGMPLDPTFAKVRTGISTGDNERFYKLSWEHTTDSGWLHLANGGAFSPYYRPAQEVIDWRHEGAAILNLCDETGKKLAFPRSLDLVGKPGLCWGKRGNFLSIQVHPSGRFFTNEGQVIIPFNQDDAWRILAVVNSRLLRALINEYCGQHKENGYVSLLPIPNIQDDDVSALENAAVLSHTALRTICKFRQEHAETIPPCYAGATLNEFIFKTMETLASCEAALDTYAEQINEVLERVFALDADGLSWLADTTRHMQKPVHGADIFIWENQAFASEAMDWLIGFSFGRWDIRFATGECQPPELPDPFAPLPVCPPGMLQNSEGLPAEPKDVPSDYPLRISWKGILVDDENHTEDIIARIEDALKVIWNDRWEAIEQEACDLLGVKTIRDYFRRPVSFFADHLKRYSKSRRQAPIYWPLSTANGSYTLWIYYQRLTDQTLHTALADFVDPKLKAVRTEINSLRESGKHQSRLEELRDLEKELSDFRDEIERIIKLPWKPNLNDGVIITASPLWKLFRLPKWQKDLKACWDKLEKGEYDWAHLAYSIWPKRVEDVCKKDRSIAIAHNLEDLCEVTPSKPKAKRGKNKSKET